MLLFVTLGIILIRNTNCCNKVTVIGDSMYPAFEDGDEVSYITDINTIKSGDVIIFTYEDATYIKRVIGVSGDTIKILENKVYLNNEMLNDLSYDFGSIRYFIHDQITVVGNDEVFVLGDNYNNSEDSRLFGCVPISNIKGIVKE